MRPSAIFAASALICASCAAPASNAPPPPPAIAASSPSVPAASTAPDASSTDIVALYTRACDGGAAVGCNDLARVYLEGRSGAPKDPKRAVELLERACNMELPRGCANLGLLLLKGIGTARNEARGLELLAKACESSDWYACNESGEWFTAKGHEDLPRAVSLYERACNGNYQVSCTNLASLLQTGRGVPKDARKAGQLYERACKANVAIACTGLANMVLEGDGTPPEPARAFALYEKGCTDRNPTGCYVMGILCAAGKLGDVCADRWEPLLKQACDRGHAKACAELAARLEKRNDR